MEWGAGATPLSAEFWFHILGVITEKPYNKLLDCNAVYSPITILNHATSVMSK